MKPTHTILLSEGDDNKYFAVGLGFFVAVVLFVIYLVTKG